MSAQYRTLATGIAFAATASLIATTHADDPFPHERHARLFPVCVGCHEGITTGASGAYYPAPSSCARCHDGEREERVEWSAPTREPTNLRFDHVAHAREIASAERDELDCEECHTQRDAPRMAVESPIPARCFECHEHGATEHFVDADCATCHVPLVETALPRARIAALPLPATHEREDFLAQAHGELVKAAPASCATCHSREQCSACHVAFVAGSPAERVPEANGRIDAPLIAARYPVPASHREPDWERTHGRVATRAACITCHARDGCSSCHTSPQPQAVTELPWAAEVTAPGAVISRAMPESHTSVFFAVTHGALATARPQSCSSCHDRSRFCGACHETREPPAQSPQASRAERSRRGFHPPNFASRHAAIPYGRRLDCSSCHSTQRFCRECHQNLGMASAGRLGPGYHDAEPVWLLRHGQAGRQSLETCASCHTQRDCMQCHSQLGAFRVSPHGPTFDARKAQRTNPQICRACHLTDPLTAPR